MVHQTGDGTRITISQWKVLGLVLDTALLPWERVAVGKKVGIGLEGVMCGEGEDFWPCFP